VATAAANAATSEQTAADNSAQMPKTHLGEPGAVSSARAALGAKQLALTRIVGSPDVLADMVKQLQAISTAPPIAPGIKARIADLGAKATDTVPAKQQVEAAAQAALQTNEAETAQLELDVANNVAGAQAQLDAHLAAHPGLQAAADAAHAEVVASQAAAPHATDKWEDAVPEDAWRRLLTFDEITRQLDNDLALLDAAAVTAATTQLTDAETALALALSARDQGQRQAWTAALLAEQKHREATAVRDSRSTALLAALRGDN
jgi:hypothetical protein